MAKTSASKDVGLSVEDTWSALTDLSRFEEWLTLHEAWRSDLPDAADLGKGTKISSIVAIKTVRIRFDWVVDAFKAGNEVVLKGQGKGGIKAKLDFSLKPSPSGSMLVFEVDLGGLPLIGPAGKAAAKAVSGDLDVSLAKFADVFGG